MKKIFLIAVVLLVIIIIDVSSVSASTNLIPNSSLEQVDPSDSTQPLQWYPDYYGDMVVVFKYPVAGYQDAKAGQITISTFNQSVEGDAKWFFEPVTITAGKKYTFTNNYKSSVNTTVTLQYTQTNGSFKYVDIGTATSSTSWKQFSATFTAPTGTKKVSVFHRISAVGTLTVDNYSLIEQGTQPPSDPPGGNLILNPSVETVSSSNTNLPQFWKSYKEGSNTVKFNYLKTGHTGSRSLQVNVTKLTNGTAYYASDPVAVEGGKTYTYGYYYKSSIYSEVNAVITLQNGEEVYQYLGSPVPATKWTAFSAEIRMPENAKQVTLYSLLYEKGTLTTDDYSLVKKNVVPFNRAMVTITFDDFFAPFYDTVFPMFKEHGYKGTAYIVSGDIGKSTILSSQKAKEMAQYGFEFGSHSVTHPHMPLLSSTEIEKELIQSKTDIAQYTGITPMDFSTPYGEYSDTVIQKIKTQYNSHRSVDVGYNSKGSFDRYNIKAMSAVNTTAPETVLEWVDSAIKDKTWLVLVYHDIVENGDTFTNSPQHLKAVLDGLKSRGVAVMTTQDALQEISNQI